MSDYIRKYTGKLFSNPLGRWLAITGATATAVLWPQSDDARIKSKLSIVSNIIPTQEQAEKYHTGTRQGRDEEIRRQAERHAWDATEQLMSDKEFMKQYLSRLYGLDKESYTKEDCLKCSELNTPLYEEVIAISERFNKDPNLILSMIWNESRFNPEARSKSGAVGLMQTKEITVEEICSIYKNLDRPFGRHKGYVNARMDVLEYYKDFFDGKFDKVYERLEKPKDWSDIVLGLVIGFTNTDFEEYRHDGDPKKKLGAYFLGKDGFEEKPQKAEDYIEAALDGKTHFEECARIRDEIYKSQFNILMAKANQL